MLLVRAKGAQQAYWGGIDDKGKLAVYRQNFGFEKLAETDFAWDHDTDIQMTLSAIGDRISVRIDDEKLLEVRDNELRSGMVGCGSLMGSRTLWGPFAIEEL